MLCTKWVKIKKEYKLNGKINTISIMSCIYSIYFV